MCRLRLISLSVLSLAVAMLCTSDALALQTFRYTIVSNGKTAGSEVDTYSQRHSPLPSRDEERGGYKSAELYSAAGIKPAKPAK